MRTFSILCVGSLLAIALASGASAQEQKQGPKKVLAQLLKDIKETKDPARQVQAAMELAEFGADAKPALGDLIAALQSKHDDAQLTEDLRLNAAIAIGKIGKPAVPALRELLGGTNKDARFYAIWALGWVGPDAADAAPDLIKAMADKDDNIRRKAAYSLGRIAASPKKTIDVLLAAFKDPHEDVRQAASDALAKFGKDAVPGLLEALKDTDVKVRLQAARAVHEMGTDAKDAAPLLRDLLLAKDSGNEVNDYAQALSKLGKAGVPALIDAFKDDRANVQQAAFAALHQSGADAVPALVDALGDKKATVRRLAAQVLMPLRVSDKSVVTALAYAIKNDDDDSVRQICVQCIAQLGVSGKLAAPALVHALSDSNNQVRFQAFYALQNMGENARDGLLKALNNKDDRIRINTAALMLQVNVEANTALPILVDALKHDNEELRIQAAFAMAQTGREVNKLLPFFKEGLKSKVVRARLQSLQGLAMMHQHAAPAGAEIIEALADADAEVRLQAVRTLQSVPADAEAAVKGLAKLFKDDKGQGTRIAIVQIMPRYQAKAMPLLLEAIKDKDAQVRQQAVWAMQNTQGDLSAYHKEISALIKDKDVNVRANLINLLGRTGEKGVQQLGEMLSDPEWQVRWQAVIALQNSGKNVIKVLPALIKALSDENPNVRSQASYAIAQGGEEGAKALLKAYAEHKDAQVRIQILSALFNTQARKHATPLLKEALKDPDKELRRYAVQMLPNLGQTQEVYDAVTEALKDKEVAVRVAAAYAVQSFGPRGMPILENGLKLAKDSSLRVAMTQVLLNNNHRSKTMVGPLTEFLKDGNPQVRWQSAQLLGNIGPDAKDALPTLRDLVSDSNPNVRQFAQKAINQIDPPKE